MEGEREPLLGENKERQILGEDEEKPLLTDDKTTQVYSRRWWILAVYSGFCFQQALVWNTWGPITQSAKAIFHWSDGEIGMLANWGNIAYIITVFPACYFMDERGLYARPTAKVIYGREKLRKKEKPGMRKSLLGCGVLLVLGNAMRCFTSNADYALWLMNGCAILNGIAGTVPFAGPPLLASTWFPPGQRATATATASVSNYAGVAFAFVIGPQLVSSPIYGSSNNTHNGLVNRSHHYSTPSILVTSTEQSNKTVLNLSTVRNEVMRLMYIECGMAVVLFLAALLYFPDKPPHPPSKTASIERVNYKKGLLNIIRHGPVWLISLAYAIPAGVYGVYSSVFDVILNPVGVGQDEVGWIGFYSLMAGCGAGLVIARFSDIFMKHMKLFLLLLYILAGGAFVWLTLLCTKIIPFSTVQLYLSSILGGMFVNACIPLFYELCCEASYPVSEGVTGGFLTLLNNFFGISFLLVLLIPNIGTAWMNIALCCSIGLGLLCLLLFPERYTRTDIDIHVQVETDIQTHVTDVKTTITENVHQIS